MDGKDKHIETDLLMLYLTGQADSLQTEKIGLWLSESDEHAAYLKSLEMLWIETGKISPPPVNVDVKKAWESVSGKLNFNTDNISGKNKSRLHIGGLWLRVAAIVVLLIAIYSLYQWSGTGKPMTLVASEGQITIDTLPDGSEITLNSNSVLQFSKSFQKKERIVKLQGEAFFEVRPDSTRPFKVELDGDASVKVLGTSFNIKEIKESGIIEVYVQSGIVQLSLGNENQKNVSLILKAGEKGSIYTKTGIIEKQPDIGMNAIDIAWLNHTFIFDGVKLKDVADFIESYFHVNVEFKKEAIKEHILTATFRNDDIDEIMQIIADSFNLQLTQENGTYLFDEADR
jgi:ferric-dicitrate binding protein FerR (iron transport regulator)